MKIVVALLVLGCVSPSFDEGYACGPGGECPPGQRCGGDRVCRRNPLDGAIDGVDGIDGIAGIDGQAGQRDGAPDAGPADAMDPCFGLSVPPNCLVTTCTPPSCPLFTCPGDPRCMVYCPVIANFDLAEQNCRIWGGELVSIANDTVNSCVAGATGGGSVRAWIGYRQSDTADDLLEGWYWTDDAPTGYERWATQEPNDQDDSEADHKEQCVWIDIDGSWGDIACTNSAPFVCAR